MGLWQRAAVVGVKALVGRKGRQPPSDLRTQEEIIPGFRKVVLNIVHVYVRLLEKRFRMPPRGATVGSQKAKNKI